MKTLRTLFVMVLGIYWLTIACYAIPGIINYQGTIEVDDQPYSGTGYFHFALVDPGSTVLWTNDGAFPPVESIEVTLVDGLFNVLLGSSGNMNVIPNSAFAGEEVFLRIWFSEDDISFQRLLPDQQLVSTGYAFQSVKAANADQVDGHDYQFDWPTTLDTVQAACSDDFHAIGGIDDDQPDDDSEVPDDITVNNGLLYAASGGTMVGIGTTSPLSKLSLGNDITEKKLALFDAQDDFYGFGLDSGRMVISTADEERMTVTNLGRVGIGTNEPETSLHVSGDGLQCIRLTSTDATGAGIQFLRTGITYRDWRLEAGNSFQISTSADDASSWIDFLTIDAFGNVGIGNDTPAYTLHVDGTIFSESGGFRFPDGSEQVTAATGDGHSLDASDGSPNDAIYVNALGRVGIGETSPVEMLQVDGKIYSSTGGFRFPDDSQQTRAAFGDGHSLDASDGTPSDALVVDDSGNVGIGVAIPEEKLHVAGLIRSSVDGFQFPDNSIQSSAASGDANSLDAVGGSPENVVYVNSSGNVGINDIYPDAFLEIASGAGGDPVFMISSSGDSDGDFLTVDTDGDVGIGVKFPDAILEVSASGSSSKPVFSLSSNDISNGDILNVLSTGLIGIGTQNPAGYLEISAGGTTGTSALVISSNDGLGDLFKVRSNGNVGIGHSNPQVPLQIDGGTDATTTDGGYLVIGDGNGSNIVMDENEIMARNNGAESDLYIQHSGGDTILNDLDGRVGIGTDSPETRLHVNGRITCNTLKLEGGSDLAEPFEISGNTRVEPGMVVSIDPEHPGELKVSEKAYDRCVAGIVSGAGGIEPAVMMNQDDMLSGSQPVALTGRVYCLADATDHPIVPGDLLTTSFLPGHAMAVEQEKAAHGAIIGKAMTALDSGTGMVMCLVNLQ